MLQYGQHVSILIPTLNEEANVATLLVPYLRTHGDERVVDAVVDLLADVDRFLQAVQRLMQA